MKHAGDRWRREGKKVKNKGSTNMKGKEGMEEKKKKHWRKGKVEGDERMRMKRRLKKEETL